MWPSPLSARSCSDCCRASASQFRNFAAPGGLEFQTPGVLCALTRRSTASNHFILAKALRRAEALRRRLRRYPPGGNQLLGFASIRLQRLPEQKNLPRAHASTRREFGPFISIVP